jgi:hypothetical protein
MNVDSFAEIFADGDVIAKACTGVSLGNDRRANLARNAKHSILVFIILKGIALKDPTTNKCVLH